MGSTRVPTRLILLDWTWKNNPTTLNHATFLWELALLSLLYDEVLIQDNVLLSSQKLAEWFVSANRFRVVEEFFDLGLLVVLKRPQHEYPDERLIQLAGTHPIQARATLIASASTYHDGNRIMFSDQQHRFQERLEACLAASKKSHRFAGEKRRFDLMKSFGLLLREALTTAKYTKWRQTHFPHIGGEMASEFAKYSEIPELAVARLRAQGKNPGTIAKDGKLEFNTSLAMQVAKTFGSEQSERDMQRLIATTFAAPFCWGEDSKGAYGKRTRELVLIPERFTDQSDTERLVKPDVATAVSVALPEPLPGFGQIVRSVRESKAGVALRQSMSKLGKQLTFEQQERSWQAVAEEMKCKLVGKRASEVTLWSVGLQIGKHLLYDTLVNVPWRFAALPPLELSDILKASAVPALAIGGDYIYEILQTDLNAQKLSVELQRAVTFRCVDVPQIAVAHS